jgi:serine/threonine-protein kinase RsbW
MTSGDGQLRGTPAISLALELPQDAVSIPVVRHICEHALLELGCVSDCSDAVALAVTEACANVVQHAGPSEAYRIEVTITAEVCEMRVIDSSGTFVAAVADESIRHRAVDPMSESGRGLDIIRAMTDDLWLESTPEVGTLVHMVKVLAFDEEAPARRLLNSATPAER